MYKAKTILLFSIIIASILLVHCVFGNGMLHMVKGMTCKVISFVKKTIKEEARLQIIENETPINLPVLISEVLLVALTMTALNKYSVRKKRDRIDELLQESRQGLQYSNELLEKWRLRRVKTERSYLDEEPQPIPPLKLEVPILHMAIIDTRGTHRSQPERGDAGDSVNIIDSTLLSVTSILDDDLESIFNARSDVGTIDGERTVDVRSRFLWNVQEEEVGDLENR
ncbi:unnamed protein product [Parnassius mnemosyne]|uniref:Transmembrane protein n=1 Tax=Parnassius mnemosyne TaxID=213953 RepID=A0AAV1LF61_9NEOP